MLFNSAQYLIFFIIVFIGNWLLKGLRIPRYIFLLIASYYFYMSWNPIFIILIIFSSLLDYLCGYFLDILKNNVYRKVFLGISLVGNLGLLFIFKYINFFGTTLNSLLLQFNVTDIAIPYYEITLPVGISFYTFQTLSYSIDIYRGELKRANSFLDYMLYVSFFPQLVAGPIVRAADFIPQLAKKAVIDNVKMSRGFFLIMVGLVKKVIIADYIAINLADRVFTDPTKYTSLECLIGIYAYAMQIYCDFSGYSDIAIGSAYLIGFDLPLNFNVPYISANVQEFWHRWHISLSTWLRDYLYIPLGGSRSGKIATYRNLLITMLLGGLWHGASWNFVIWGALHGTLLAFTRMWQRSKWQTKMPNSTLLKPISIFLTFNFVCFAWIFFRSPDFAIATDILKQISKLDMGAANIPLLAIILMSIGYITHFTPRKMYGSVETAFTKLSPYAQAALLTAIIGCTYKFASIAVVPFIYFQF